MYVIDTTLNTRLNKHTIDHHRPHEPIKSTTGQQLKLTKADGSRVSGKIHNTHLPKTHAHPNIPTALPNIPLNTA
jgi:hypothetical protein